MGKIEGPLQKAHARKIGKDKPAGKEKKTL